MVDHVACDLELRMADGMAFEAAWQDITADISIDHFKLIQTETMETINKRFAWSQGLSILALTLLFASTLFKILHLQYADVLLVASFIVLASSLITSSLTGVFLRRGKAGAGRVLVIVVGITIMLLGYLFKFLHWPGADQIVLIAATIMIASFLINTIFIYKHSSGRANLLIFLHEKYTPGIERFLLILLCPVALYKLVTVVQGEGAFVGGVILLVIIFGSGLQFIALCWRRMEEDLTRRSKSMLIGILASSLCLMLPFLGPMIPAEIRIIVIMGFSSISAWLALRMEAEPYRLIPVIIVCLVPVVFAGWGLVHLGFIPVAAATIFFNIPILVALFSGLVLSRKHGVMRAYLLVSCTSYLLEYIVA